MNWTRVKTKIKYHETNEQNRQKNNLNTVWKFIPISLGEQKNSEHNTYSWQDENEAYILVIEFYFSSALKMI